MIENIVQEKLFLNSKGCQHKNLNYKIVVEKKRRNWNFEVYYFHSFNLWDIIGLHIKF